MPKSAAIAGSPLEADAQVLLREARLAPRRKCAATASCRPSISITMERQPDPEGDRVKIVMTGKFLDYKRC